MRCVVAKEGHVAMRVERCEANVVRERKMSRYEGQVNARFMSSCVSNSQRDSRAVMTKSHARNV